MGPISPEALGLLQKYLQNVENDPNNPKYRRIRIRNAAFARTIHQSPPARTLLAEAGWEEVTIDEEGYLLLAADVGPSRMRELLHTASQSPEEQARAERQVALKERKRKEDAERKRIRDQMRGDRTEVASRSPASAATGNVLPFGGRLNTFRDVGVDLNSGGG